MFVSISDLFARISLSRFFFFFASLSLSLSHSLTHSLTQHFRHTTIYDLIDSTLPPPGHQYHRHGQTRSCTTRDETGRNKSKFHNTAETKITLQKMVVGIPPHLHPSRAHHNPTNVCLLSSPLCNISQQQQTINHFPSPKTQLTIESFESERIQRLRRISHHRPTRHQFLPTLALPSYPFQSFSRSL